MTLLFTNCTILPMTGERTPDEFVGAVGVVDNRLALVSADPDRIEAFRQAHPDRREIDATGKLLMPGLINTHCHVAMTLQRGYADDIPLMSWLHDYIWPFEAKQTPDEIEVGAELGIVEMLLGGTTLFVDMYWSEHRVAEAVRRLGIRAMLGACYLDGNWDGFTDDLNRLTAIASECSRIRPVVAPHAPYSCTPEILQRGKELARNQGLLYTIHIAETQDEVRQIQERYGTTPTRHLDALGVLDDRTIGAHCVHVTDEDIRILKERGVAVAHNPQSNMKISSGVAPIARMRREGVLCTIATDGTCSNNDLDMWDEMRSASFLQKVSTMDPLVLPAYEVLKMATVDAARAVGMAGELGVICEGALADFILIDLCKPHLMPVHNLVANLIYCANASDVDTVVVDGEIVVEERRIRVVEVADLCRRAQQAADRIVRRVAESK